MLPPPGCPHGYTRSDLEGILGDRLPAFDRFMRGQTVMLCDGTTYRHDREHNEHCGHAQGEAYDWKCGYPGGGHYEDSPCAGHPHGLVVYPCDLQAFLDGRPPCD